MNPNATKKIEIAFTPDFTLSRVERKLLALTSVGSDSADAENGVMIFNLLATLPAHSLDLCASVLARPSWERAVQWTAISLSSIMLISVLVVSLLEADRVLQKAFTSSPKDSTVQSPLDLRLLSHISTQAISQISGFGGSNTVTIKNEKIANDEKVKTKTMKDEAFPDWSLMNVKKSKDKDAQKGLKIPDWTADEERRFKLDVESKDLLSFKRCEELSNVDNNINSNITANVCSSKKKNKKQNNIQETQPDNCAATITLADTQLVQEKKYTANTVTKSSPTSNRKGKTAIQPIVKEEPKLIDNEVQVDAGIINNNRNNKSDNKRKQINSAGNNSNHNNQIPIKKYESTNAQKTIHLSEEETSSTTTESSTHDETTCKVSID